jgi:hypothetical protein
VNIAHVHIRFARLASERDGQLGTTVTLTRREPARLIFDVLRHRESDTCRTVAAKGGTAHLLFGIAIVIGLNVRVERLAGNDRFQAMAARYARQKSVSSNFNIPHGGYDISCLEDIITSYYGDTITPVCSHRRPIHRRRNPPIAPALNAKIHSLSPMGDMLC